MKMWILIEEDETIVGDVDPDSPDSGGIRYTKEIPKLYQCVQYKSSDADNWKNAKIIGRAGKATGKYKFWLNVKDLDDDVESPVDFEKVTEWRPTH